MTAKRGHRAETTKELVDDMQVAGVEPSVITHATLGHKAEKASADLISACEKSELGPRPEAPISACEGGHKADKVLELFDELQQRGYMTDVAKWHDVISGCTKGFRGHKPDVAMQLLLALTTTNAIAKLQDMEPAACQVAKTGGRGLEPNAISYPDLFSACEKGHILVKAIELVAEKQEKGVIPDASTYTALISACGKGHKVDEAVELLAGMQSIGLEPNVLTYVALVSVCEKSHKAEKARELFAEGQRRGLIPGLISYNSLINACGKGGRGTKVSMGEFAKMQWNRLGRFVEGSGAQSEHIQAPFS